MSYYSFRWWFFLIFFVVCGYYVLRFFGKLWDVDMYSIIAERFRAGALGWLLLFTAALFYSVFIFGVFYFLETPVQIFHMKSHHAGGLLGYRDGWNAHVYDPSSNAYVAYEHLNPPLAADKFTEAFETVLLYKRGPSSKYYQDTSLLSLSFFLQALVGAAVGLVVLYFILYIMVESGKGPKIKPLSLTALSHQVAQFHKITGMPLVKALLIALSVYLAVLGAGVVSVKMLISHYKELYSTPRQVLKSTLLKSVSPDDTIRGRVIKRHYVEKAYIDTRRGRVDVGPSGKWRHYKVPVFTVEFRNLIHIPVYLNVTTRPSENAREVEDLLNSFFPNQWDVTPEKTPKLDFTVNPDYSISLKGNKKRSDED